MYEISNFIQFCEKNKVDLLKDDIEFIKRKLSNIPSAEHNAILSAYFKKWCEGIDMAEKSHQKQNLGRFKANSALREYVLNLNRK